MEKQLRPGTSGHDPLSDKEAAVQACCHHHNKGRVQGVSCMLLQEWFVWLSDFCDQKLGVCRWSGDLNRLHILCEWLVENELMGWFHLEHADDPGTWPGADAFAERELKFVRCFIAIGRSTPR